MTDQGSPDKPSSIEDLERICFVIMPFGKKLVGDVEVDFTRLYKELFEPAISAATTPEDLPLIPKRTDMDAFSGSITQDMYEYIMYSRVAFGDISGFNPNVFYELGARHATQSAGTVLFRQKGHAIPFDIATIKVFEYSVESDAGSRSLITNVLTESLKRNRLDSPIRQALRTQWSGPHTPRTAPRTEATKPIAEMSSPNDSVAQWRKQEVDRFLRDAEEAVRLNDLDEARTHYWGALRFDPVNLVARMRLGLVLKRQGRFQQALEEFTTVTKLEPGYAEAWKEKGIIEGLVARMIPVEARTKTKWLQDGSQSLKRATQLDPGDFDAWASLGGVYTKVQNNLDAAQLAYGKATEVSDGHPYPLLNSLKLEALRVGKMDLDAAAPYLEKAHSMRLAQATASPPSDTPWCWFDLAEISLYRTDPNASSAYLERGLQSCTASWQPKTFRDTLANTLVASNIDIPGLKEGITRLDVAIAANPWASG